MISSIKISFSCPSISTISIYQSKYMELNITGYQLDLLLKALAIQIGTISESHIQIYIIMIQPQYKQSERQEESKVQISEEDLLTFITYNKVSSFLSTHKLPYWDYDVNRRAQRQQYINLRNQHSRIKKRREQDNSIHSSMVTELSNKKSSKSKVQSAKLSNYLMIQTPQDHLVSKIKDEKPQETKSKDEKLTEPFQFKLPMHSKFSHQFQLETPSQPSKPFKEEEKIEEEEAVDGKSSNKIQISVLPLIQQQSRKIQYYGSQQPQITTLNDFIVKPLKYEIETKSVHNKIDEHSKHRSHKSKLQKSEVSSPLSIRKDQKREEKPSDLQQFILPTKQYKKNKGNLSIPQMNNRFTESFLINTEESQKEKKSQDVPKSKSKSKSKIKKVKDSTIFKRKPRMNHSPCFGNSQVKKTQSPELPHEPITHMNQKQLAKSSHNSAKKSISHISHSNKSSSPIPVEDYDNLFDASRADEDIEFKSSEVDQNIDISKPYGNKDRKEQTNMLPYYQIPLYSIKKNKPGDIPGEVKMEEGKPQKTPRRKIFSHHQQKDPRSQTNTDSSDLSIYTDEEMRMILGAKGNKYKETIVKQYIKLQRQNQRNKID